MSFPHNERAALLATKGVGPTVIARLEQLGFHSLADLAHADATMICEHMAERLNSTCWKNSPQARAAINNAIKTAQQSVIPQKTQQD